MPAAIMALGVARRDMALPPTTILPPSGCSRPRQDLRQLGDAAVAEPCDSEDLAWLQFE